MKKLIVIIPVILLISLSVYIGITYFNIGKYDEYYINNTIPVMKEEYIEQITSLKEKYNNKDVVGTISIDNTDFNTVVMQGNDNSYYLNHLPDKTYNINGSIFLDYRVDIDDIKSSMNDMLSSIDSIVAILIIAAASLAFVVLYNLSNINISERKREIATLKVLGFYQSEVDKYINRETVLLTILGIGIGLLFGSYLSHFIISTCEPDYIMFDRHVYTLSYFYSLFITVIFTIIVTIVTHFNLKKINMVTSLKNVE